MWAPSSWCCLPHWEYWDPSDLSDLDDIEEAINNELLPLSNPQSGEGDGNPGNGGLWSLLCLLQSQPLGGPMWWWFMVRATIPRGILYRVTSWAVKPEGLLGQQIYMWMSWPPHLHLVICYSLGNGSLTFLDCHGFVQQGRPIFQPMYLLLWVGMQHL